jgi:hypothetical protein
VWLAGPSCRFSSADLQKGSELMAYPSMKKAVQAAQATLSSAVPVVNPIANRGGVRFNHGEQFVYDGPSSNPIEALARNRDEAKRRVEEAQDLLNRARNLFYLTQRAPYYQSFAAKPSPQELKDIAHADEALQQYSAQLIEAIRVLNAAGTALSGRLMGWTQNAGQEPEEE